MFDEAGNVVVLFDGDEDRAYVQPHNVDDGVHPSYIAHVALESRALSTSTTGTGHGPGFLECTAAANPDRPTRLSRGSAV